ncbi:hypothetical protein [Priestia megaterium]|uniref:hypothetical protein n=1 Tax=Priestia megaterium TaxID=1404 RepID=UPI000BA65CF0|nr:hypothetical protein [Priestia megaterium]PAK47608.1 hypothetical protein CHH47_19370 [Priestia megaterium]
MQLLNNKLIQTVLLGAGALLLFGMIFYSLFAQAFPKNAEEEALIKQFEQVRKDRATYYKNHPHKELSEQ